MPPSPHPPAIGRALVLARRAAAVPLGAALALVPACDRTHGEVELNWTVVDVAGAQVFPGGDRINDLCRFIGRLEPDAPRTRYGLHVELRLCEPGCPEGCSDPACQVARLPYDCAAARGFDTVPARDDPYELTVALVAEPEGACKCELTSACALIPGPRLRAVEPGLVTDLQVYLLVLTGLDLTQDREEGRLVMDLDGCCVPDSSCS